jgi:hypothetical protein
MARSTAGQSLDLINIMAYDAGSLANSGFDPKESFRAHKAAWPNAAIALGVEVPPEGALARAAVSRSVALSCLLGGLALGWSSAGLGLMRPRNGRASPFGPSS